MIIPIFAALEITVEELKYGEVPEWPKGTVC